MPLKGNNVIANVHCKKHGDFGWYVAIPFVRLCVRSLLGVGFALYSAGVGTTCSKRVVLLSKAKTTSLTLSLTITFPNDRANRVKCHFNQPAKKKSRRIARAAVGHDLTLNTGRTA